MPNTAASRLSAASAPADRPSRRRRVLYPLATVLILTGLSLGAFHLGRSVERSRAGDLQITGHFSGTVSYIDLDGSAFCVTPPGHEQRCSVPYVQPSSDQLTLGEHVSVATAQLHEGDQTKEVFIVLAR
ncbi:MAG: hypothetical protein M3P04_12340 [Actinomycetota bacterium]|nr:hypothetical protein [Actinomycetota bacterium]